MQKLKVKENGGQNADIIVNFDNEQNNVHYFQICEQF